MALGVVRDKINESMPPQVREHVNEMMNRVTTKLGGQPVAPGALFGGSEEPSEGDGAHMARSMG